MVKHAQNEIPVIHLPGVPLEEGDYSTLVRLEQGLRQRGVTQEDINAVFADDTGDKVFRALFDYLLAENKLPSVSSNNQQKILANKAILLKNALYIPHLLLLLVITSSIYLSSILREEFIKNKENTAPKVELKEGAVNNNYSVQYRHEMVEKTQKDRIDMTYTMDEFILFLNSIDKAHTTNISHRFSPKDDIISLQKELYLSIRDSDIGVFGVIMKAYIHKYQRLGILQ